MVPSKQKQIEVINKLPLLSARVYLTIVDGLYAEPGFSDVDVEQVAKIMDEPLGKVAGALGTLVEKNLVWMDRVNVNDTPRAFIQANCRSNEVEQGDWKLEAKALVMTRIATLNGQVRVYTAAEFEGKDMGLASTGTDPVVIKKARKPRKDKGVKRTPRAATHREGGHKV